MDVAPETCAPETETWSSAKVKGYRSSKAIVGASFEVFETAQVIGFIGVNLPPRYSKGKNHMVERYLQDMANALKTSDAFILGDLNARLSLGMWMSCDCKAVPPPTPTELVDGYKAPVLIRE